jgi:lysophospholipase L1-like esterase
MLGDSYMDPSWGNVGPTLMKLAGATWRPYYVGGASMNGGDGQFNIPYQFDNMAVTDNPDIKVVVMDGGGNDILLDNRQCLSTPIMGDTACHMVVSGVVTTAQTLLADMANRGVRQIVFLFYPHIDTTTIYTGPNANDWLDYAYPLAAQTCCGAATPGAGAAELTCHGSPDPGVECTFIDTRPEFVGHNDPTMPSAYWLDAFGIHPNAQGAQVIANKMWAQMQKYCIAQ